MKPEISIVIPAYNEEESLHPLFESLYPVMTDMGRPFEIIFINDGSKDSTLGILYDLYNSHPEVRVIDLNGNFRPAHGDNGRIRACTGDIVITLDADLQNPPEEIPNIVAKMDEGHDLVGTYRKGRQDPSSEKCIKNGQQDHQQDRKTEHQRLWLHAERVQQKDR
jgi:Glycosyltransferases involved in cell wall biogenesis